MRFDRRGVPHVRARTEADAYRVLGWLHAGDRMFQMELRRRRASGRLAEILGAGLVPLDREARRWRYETLARREWAALSTRDRGLLEAYAQGVSAYIATNPRPLELVALRVEPEPWTAMDSVRFLWLMVSTVGGSGALEERRLERILAAGADAVLPILEAAEGRTIFAAPEAPFRRLRPATRPPSWADAGGGGSNAWAVAGARTLSGRPCLAYDPHLPVEIPGVWYAAHLTTDDGIDAAGLTIPGAPGIVFGHNGRVAWAGTMHQADDADLFLEKMDETGLRYDSGNGWLPFEATGERIAVRGSPEVPIELRSTRHGRVLDEISSDSGHRFALTESWAPAFAGPTFPSFLASARAEDGASLASIWSRYGGPAFNICWASRDGHIGVLAAGAIPERSIGDGRLPIPGWMPGYDWRGLVPADALPRIEDPPEGFVATANDDWSAAGFDLPYPGDFAPPDRIGRIRARLAEESSAGLASLRSIQTDIESPVALRVRRALDAIGMAGREAARGAAILKSWDGRASRWGPALLLWSFLLELRGRTLVPLERQLGTDLPGGLDLLLRMLETREHERFWDDPSTPERERRDEVVSRALAAAVLRIERERGPVPESWPWGVVHAIRYRHPLSQGIPPLRTILDAPPVEVGGDGRTVAVSEHRFASGVLETVHIPSARLLIDLGRPDDSRLVLPLGQSGQFQDRRYRDQAESWAAGRDYPFPFSAEAVDAGTVSTLRLTP